MYSFILKLIETYSKKKLIYTSKVFFFQKCLVITIALDVVLPKTAKKRTAGTATVTLTREY